MAALVHRTAVMELLSNADIVITNEHLDDFIRQVSASYTGWVQIIGQ